MIVEVDDPADPRLDLYRNLRDVELRRSLEADHGVFVVEGLRTVRVLLESQWPVLSLLLTPSRLNSATDVLEQAEDRGVHAYIAGSEVFDEIAGFRVHRGVLALAERLPTRQPSEIFEGCDAVVVVEGVNDHENLGAIFRNAAALGAGAVFLDPTCCDPLYRRSVRVSLGHVLRVPFTRIVPWPAGLSELAGHGFSIVALDPRSPHTVGSMSPPEKIAVIVGAEGHGLSQAARLSASCSVRIPMAPGVDSLNVATALAIALDRLVRR